MVHMVTDTEITASSTRECNLISGFRSRLIMG